MIYCEIDNDDRVVQAMRVPPVADIAGRTDFMWWGMSIKGRREVIWRGENIHFAGTTWKPGDWFVAEIQHDIGDLVFRRYTNAQFEKTFAKVA